MIVDGLRRCSDSTKNQRSKPGRNMLTFLLVANLGIYFWDTMEVKDTVSQVRESRVPVFLVRLISGQTFAMRYSERGEKG